MPQWDDYKLPEFDVYEVEYLHGYNRGDARFEHIIPGRYYFRLKPETTSQVDGTFVLSWASNNNVHVYTS